MAEQVEGALNSMKEDAPQVKQEAPSFASQVLQDSMIARQKENTEASERTKKLLESLDSRRNMPFNPMLMKLAAGMLRPTKTGSFGESLGYAAEGMSEQAEKEFKQRQEDAKLRFELESKMAEQRRQAAGMEVTNKLFSGRPANNALGASSNAPSAVDSPFPAEGGAINPAEILSVDSPNINITGNSKKIPLGSSPSIDLSTKLAENQQQTMPSLTLDEKNIYRQVDPEGFKFLEEQEENQRKIDKNRRDILIPFEVDGVKTFLSPQENDRLEKAIEARDEKTVRNILLKKGIRFNYIIDKSGEWSPKSAAQAEAEKEAAKERAQVAQINYFLPEVGDNIPMDKSQAMDYRAARKRAEKDGGASLQEWYNENFPELGITVQRGKPSTVAAKPNTITVNGEKIEVPVVGKPPIGEAARKQWEAEQDKNRRLAEKRAEADLSIKTALPLAEQQAIAKDNIIRDVSTATDIKNSYQLIENAESLLSLMTNKDTKGAWGYWSNPNYKDAFINFVKDGVKAGNYSLGIPALGEALRQAGMTDDELIASARAAQIYGEMKTQIAQKAMDGQGSVSNYERSLVTDISAGIDTPLKAAMASAELMKYRGLFDQKSGEIYNQWREANPGIASSKFVLSDQYKALQKDYNKSMISLREKYFPTSKPSAKPAAPASATTSAATPPASSLVEGSNTTFSNGQVWTLEKGKPKRVDK
jgi:hypothetical protein